MRRSASRMHQPRAWDTALSGDYEDPRKRGILRNTSCHTLRQQLQNTEQANILQGLMIVTGMATALVVLWFHSLDPTTTTNTTTTPTTPQPTATTTTSTAAESSAARGTLQALWLGVSGLLGLGLGVAGQPALPPGNLHCSQRLDTRRIFRQIGKQVLNQEQALARLERAVKSERSLKSVALLGPPGVGKTLTAMALRQQFPWPENVHSYSWSTYVPDGAHKFYLMRNFVEQLSGCGQNLLIIDNLCPCDFGIVGIYNKLLLEREGETTFNQTVLVVYIFNLDMEHYWQQFELLQQLPLETSIINYRSFGRAELLACLENELRLEQRSLDRHTLSHILEVAQLDVEETGCKRIRQLLIQHGLSDLN